MFAAMGLVFMTACSPSGGGSSSTASIEEPGNGGNREPSSEEQESFPEEDLPEEEMPASDTPVQDEKVKCDLIEKIKNIKLKIKQKIKDVLAKKLDRLRGLKDKIAEFREKLRSRFGADGDEVASEEQEEENYIAIASLRGPDGVDECVDDPELCTFICHINEDGEEETYFIFLDEASEHFDLYPHDSLGGC